MVRMKKPVVTYSVQCSQELASKIWPDVVPKPVPEAERRAEFWAGFSWFWSSMAFGFFVAVIVGSA